MRRVTQLALVVLPICSLGLGYASARDPTPPASTGNPLASLQPVAPAEPALRGSVEQRLPAGSYTYLSVRAPDHTLHWAVTMGPGEPVGSKVVIHSVGHSVDFYSRRLSRRFSELAFGIVTLDEGIEEAHR